MTWVHDTALQGERTVGTQALVTGDGDQGAVTAPALALVYTVQYSVFSTLVHWHWHVTCYLMAHGDVIMTAACVRALNIVINIDLLFI